MLEIIKYATSNGFAVFLGSFFILCVIAHLIHRIIRFLMVSIHGWPPPHLDADGNFKSSEQEN